jgi:hypothetical protein
LEGGVVHPVPEHSGVYVGLLCTCPECKSHNQPSPSSSSSNRFLDVEFCRKIFGVQPSDGLANTPDPSEEQQIRNDFDEKYRDFMECERILASTTNKTLKQAVSDHIHKEVDFEQYKKTFCSLTSPELQARFLERFTEKWSKLSPLFDLIKAQKWSEIRSFLKNLEIEKAATEVNQSMPQSAADNLSMPKSEAKKLKSKFRKSIAEYYQQITRDLNQDTLPKDIWPKIKLLADIIQNFNNLCRLDKNISSSNYLSSSDRNELDRIRHAAEFQSVSDIKVIKPLSEPHIRNEAARVLKKVPECILSTKDQDNCDMTFDGTLDQLKRDSKFAALQKTNTKGKGKGS